jgi:CubicO group peptidase (beta-lactamase class C family)
MVLLSCLPAWAESASSDPRPNEVNAICKEFDRKDSPGCSLAVIKKNKLIYEHGYGMADLDYNIPLTPSSEFYLASMSKQFTAFSVALLIEQGKVGLNDPLIKYPAEYMDQSPSLRCCTIRAESGTSSHCLNSRGNPQTITSLTRTFWHSWSVKRN